MIQMVPIPREELAAFCREKGIAPGDQLLRGYRAFAGEETLGWCVAAEEEPCLILGVSALDPQLGDGLLRAVLFPLYEEGIKGYRFACAPLGSLPGEYVLQGEGELSRLFIPCSEKQARLAEAKGAAHGAAAGNKNKGENR